MADVEMRPRFAVPIHGDVETVVKILGESVGEADPSLEGSFGPAHCVLRVPEDRRAFWSPELDLTFELMDVEDGQAMSGVLVHGLFTPRPAVWTGFAFIYAALSAVGLVSAFFGLAQLTLSQSPWGLALAPGALVLIGGIYAASFIGQGLAARQMCELRGYLDDCLERADEQARLAPKTSFDSARL